MTAIVTPRDYFNAVYDFYIADTQTLNYPDIPQYPNLCLFDIEDCFICNKDIIEYSCQITINEI